MKVCNNTVNMERSRVVGDFRQVADFLGAHLQTLRIPLHEAPGFREQGRSTRNYYEQEFFQGGTYGTDRIFFR
jgi:hypothetical protein